MYGNVSPFSLPATAAGGLIKVVSPTHATFGYGAHSWDVFLTPGGGSKIIGPVENNWERIEIIPQDAWSGLVAFLEAARVADEAGSHMGRSNYAGVTVGLDTLAHLFGERRVTLPQIFGKALNSAGRGYWDIEFTRDDEFSTIRFSPELNFTTIAGVSFVA